MRYLLILLGLLSIAFGIVGYRMHPPIPVEARPITVDEALALVDAGETPRVYVTLAAGLDLATPVYQSLVPRPRWVTRPPGELYDLSSPEAADLTSFLGTRVTTDGELEPRYLALQGVAERTLQEDEVLSERLLAPLSGTGLGLWVLSPVVETEERQGWLAREGFEGVLTRLAEIGENTETYALRFDYEEIRAHAAREIDAVIPDDALVVLEGARQKASRLVSYPALGSRGALLVSPFYTGDELPPWASTGPITGVLWSWEGGPDDQGHLAALLGEAPRARYGVIEHDETASELNRKTTFGLRLFVGIGLACLFLGGLGVARRRGRTA